MRWLLRVAATAVVIALYALAAPDGLAVVPVSPTAATAVAPLQLVPQPVILSARPGGISLVGSMDVLLDGDGSMDIDDVRAPANASGFQRPTGTVVVRQDIRPRWFRFSVQQQGKAGDWAISVPSVSVSNIQFYGPFDGAGSALASPVVTGLAHDYASRPLGSEQFIYRFDLPTSDIYTFYVRAETDVPQWYQLSVWDLGQYLVSMQTQRLFEGMAYGILLGMLVYNLILCLVFRDSNYIYYLLTCTFATLTIVSMNGHAARYLFPDFPQISTLLYVVAPALWLLFAGLFGRQFLELPQRAPRANLAVLGLLGLTLVSVLLGLAGKIGTAYAMTEAVALAGAVLMLVVALVCWRNGFKPAKWYLAGLAGVFGWLCVAVFHDWGLITLPVSPMVYLQLGVAIEMVVFSFALGHRLHGARHAGNELSLRADRLALAAQIDPLTGIANRDGLHSQWQQIDRPGRRHAILVLGLNHLSVEEGQQAGEVGVPVLVEAASRLQRAVRPGDAVARLGGNEFILVFVDMHTREAVEALVQRLLLALREPMQVNGEPVFLGCSMGVARFPLDSRVLDDLVGCADHAMRYAMRRGPLDYAFYDAKNQGGSATTPDSSAQ